MGRTLAPTPPMGWNSWNTFYDKINEELIIETADALVESGLRDAGYQYLIIDDCWALKDRDENGKLVPDPEKFPHGICKVSDYIHKKGLKFGLYSCCGTRTCADYPGSFGHEFSDAKQFARWGVDYLKYDNCNRPSTLSSELLYRRMGMALRNCGRDIVFAACQWGTEEVHRWIHSTGAHTFRSTIDIQDSWKSIESIALSQLQKQSSYGPGCYNDMDMLVAGMRGKGFNPETCIGGCTDTEYQTHFALWAMLGSPLIIGCDIRSLDEKTRNLLANKDLIAMNQDAENHSVYQLPCEQNPEAFILIKVLSNGEYAAGFFNFSDVPANMSVHFWDLGLPAEEKYGFSFHDCISQENIGTKRDTFRTVVKSHGCKVYRLTLEQDV